MEELMEKHDFSPGESFVFIKENVGYAVKGYIGNVNFVEIPALYNGEPVLAINDRSFSYDNVVSITIPTTIRYIRKDAFLDCASLVFNEYDNAYYIGTSENPYYALIKAKDNGIESCEIHRDTFIIADGAFKGCHNIENIIIPDNVTRISKDCFYNCYRLTSVTLPNRLVDIDEGAFDNCGLKTLIFPDSIQNISSTAFLHCNFIEKNKYKNGFYIGTASNPYLFFLGPTSNKIRKIKFNSQMKFIGAESLSKCSNIKKLDIPEGVECIGDYAFYYCEKLTDITISEGVSIIGSGAFCCCKKLEYISIPKSVREIGKYAFSDCEELWGVDILGRVVYIGEMAFWRCEKNLWIYFKAHSEPMKSWDENWNYSKAKINWGSGY